MRKARKIAVALVSGGMDSAVAAGLAREAGYVLFALSVDYGQRHRLELSAARKVAAWLGVREHKVVKVELDRIGGSALTTDRAVPKDRRFRGIPATYVPARNLIFLSLAAAWAEVVGADRLVIGANAVDFSGYPDCRPEFTAAFQQTLKLGTRAGSRGRPIKVWAPLQHLSKAEIVKQGFRLGLDFAVTSSCYDPQKGGRPCGRCDACRLRARGFSQAGLPDPLLSASRKKRRSFSAPPGGPRKKSAVQPPSTSRISIARFPRAER